MQRIGNDEFRIVLSVPLYLEYRDVCLRQGDAIPHSEEEINDILDYLCTVAEQVKVHYLWRPCLPDPSDDMLLELAVAGRCTDIVTHNTRDFRGCESFGIRVLEPYRFLETLRE